MQNRKATPCSTHLLVHLTLSGAGVPVVLLFLSSLSILSLLLPLIHPSPQSASSYMHIFSLLTFFSISISIFLALLLLFIFSLLVHPLHASPSSYLCQSFSLINGCTHHLLFFLYSLFPPRFLQRCLLQGTRETGPFVDGKFSRCFQDSCSFRRIWKVQEVHLSD